MSRMSKKAKREWAFFLGEYGRKRYNKQCNRCAYSCKQSFRATIVCCPRFIRKAKADPPVEQ